MKSLECGRIVPLFTEEELSKARKHKRRKISKDEIYIQERLFEDTSKNNLVSVEPKNDIDNMHQLFQSNYKNESNKLIGKDIQDRKNKLRELIGLPKIRKQDEFYKFLVRKIVKYDGLEIFSEYDRELIGISPELETKINTIRNFINKLLTAELSLREKYQKFNLFSEEYHIEKKKLHT